jgi:hypothetical protein
MKIQMFSAYDGDVITEMINNFISTVNVIDIKLSSTVDTFDVLVMYDDTTE